MHYTVNSTWVECMYVGCRRLSADAERLFKGNRYFHTIHFSTLTAITSTNVMQAHSRLNPLTLSSLTCGLLNKTSFSARMHAQVTLLPEQVHTRVRVAFIFKQKVPPFECSRTQTTSLR